MNAIATPRLDFELTDDRDALYCVLSGRLDTECCERISPCLLERIRSAPKALILDLAGVPFVASAFLRLCIQASRIVGAGNLSLINTAPAIKKVLKIAGLDGPIRIV